MATLSNNNNNPEFGPEQAQLLQDIARNGSTDEYNSFEDLDTAVLLQSLADFEHPASYTELHHLPEPPTVSEPPATPSHHFASHLQAAAASDGGEAVQASRGQNQTKATAPIPPKQVNSLKNASKTTKRKRHEVEYESENDDTGGFIQISKSKRQKKKAQEEADQLARGREIWGPEYGTDGVGGRKRRTPVTGSDARAAGVQSAAALFRQPSAASKKYTRAPMATVYMQLEVSPPRFLQLQAAAKNFMLDPEHPERAECVGNKSKGDTDMTKLKLFGCVAEFLDDLGWGEKCWGKGEPTPPSADGSPADKARKLQWPEFEQQIVTLVTPLMRRMVTNERQRIYALDARKKSSLAKKLRYGDEAREASATPTEEGTPQPSGERMSAPSPSPYPAIDPKLNQYHYNVNESSMSQNQNSTINPREGELAGADGGNLQYLVNIMQNGRRIMPKITLTPISCPNYSSLVQHVNAAIDDKYLIFTTIKVLGPGTWFDVSNEDEWKSAVAVVAENEILDGEVKCAVEVGQAASQTSLNFSSLVEGVV